MRGGMRARGWRQVVRDYQLLPGIALQDTAQAARSLAMKSIVRHAVRDVSAPLQLLDIGFGEGRLAELVKGDPGMRHWQLDGVDGYWPNCCSAALLARGHYRNIWHGLADGGGKQRLREYDLVCLFDVIEHLEPEAARGLLTALLDGLAGHARLVVSTPLYFWQQASLRPGDLEEHKFGVPAASLLGLGPKMFHVHSACLIGTFVFDRGSLRHMARFQPTTDRGFDMARGLAHLAELGLAADDMLYITSG